MKLPANAIFEGGGVKAFGMLGALFEAEKRGYQWINVAGTSAGAIIASLIAAGYTSVEIKKMIWNLDLKKFKDMSWLDLIPYLGPALSLWFENGLYEGNYLEEWIGSKLAAKGVYTFKDLILNEYKDNKTCRYKLVIIATDVSRRKLLRLPYDIKDYHINPDNLEVSKAVRMSTSLPIFYEPYRLTYFDSLKQKKISYIIDGGVLSNFPVWIFDGEKVPSWPTFGFKIVEPDETAPSTINNPLDYFKSILSTMLEAHDKLYQLDPKSDVRTISIPSLGVKTVDFETIDHHKDKLFQSGVQAAVSFFEGWNFESFKKCFYNESEL